MKYFDKNKKKHRLFYVKKQGGGGLHSFSLDFDKPKRFTAIKKTAKCLDEHEIPRGIKKKKTVFIRIAN